MSSTSKTFINRIVGFSLASWVNCIITLIATPITTDLFAPEELGKISLFVSYANILIPFVYMGYDQAYLRFYNEPPGKNTKESLFKLCSIIMLFLSIVVSFVVLLFWDYFSTSIIGKSSFIVALSLMLYVVASLFCRMCNLKSRMDNNVKLFCVQSISATLIIKVSFIIVVVIKPSADYAIITRSILLFAVFSLFFYYTIRQCRSRIDFGRESLKDLSLFALPLFPTALLAMLNISLSQIMLSQYADFNMMGIYANAVTIAGLITIVQSGLGSFWTPFVFEYYKEPKLIQKAQKMVVLILFSMAFIILIFQDLIYYVLVDKSYWESKAILALLLVSPVCDSLSETMGLGIELSKKTYLKIPVYLANIIANIVACVLLIPRFGLLGAALANAIAAITMLLAKSLIGEYYYRCSDNYLKIVLLILLLCIGGIMNYIHHNLIVMYSMASLFFVLLIYKNEVGSLFKYLIAYIPKK